MKKILCTFLSCAMLLTGLCGCNIIPNDDSKDISENTESNINGNTDIWDGSIADGFSAGNGTENDPYQISTSAQLAYLAKQVNEGNSYSSSYFVLTNDINLNNIEWTPIGDGTHYFSGTFNGNGYSIRNLKITEGSSFVMKGSRDDYLGYVAGLFGVCYNSTIKSLTIDTAEISIQNTVDRFIIMAGVLVGMGYFNETFECSNITVSNTSITGKFNQENMAMYLQCGGIVGNMYGDDNSSGIISQVQSDTKISITNGRGRNNHIGGIAGYMYIKNRCDIENCASYLDIDIDVDCFTSNNYFGAMGHISSNNLVVNFINIFSKVKINKLWEYYGFPAYTANAIAGEINPGVMESGGYKFENVFGSVEQNDLTTGQKVIELRLYEFPYPEIYSETNCLGCESLPDSHLFDERIWDLSDLSHPKLK